MDDPTPPPSARPTGAPKIFSLLLVAALAGGAAACDDDPITGPDGDVVALELVADGLTSPVLAREAPDGSGRLFVVDQTGRIRIVNGDGDLLEQPFLDVTDRMVPLMTDFDERGLLGLAFHPQFATNGRLFVYYSAPLRAGAPSEYDHTSHVSEFTVSSSDPDRVDPASERVVLQVDQPQFNHDGGTVSFGDDGYLYIALGDGGGADDTGVGHASDWFEGNGGGNGQDVEANLLGSILRIDVDGASPYDVPSGNPFVGETGHEEIWAYGFRNPYRFSFDRVTGALIAGDAGQNRWEEVSLVERGGNYGWNVKEGTHCFDAENPDIDADTCPDVGRFGEPLIDPVIEYQNAAAGGPGIAVVGGFVYRGDDVPQLFGLYVFGDYSRSFGSPEGIVFVAAPTGQTVWSFEELVFGEAGEPLGAYLLGFGQDLDGEVYVLTSDTGSPTGTSGRVYRITVE